MSDILWTCLSLLGTVTFGISQKMSMGYCPPVTLVEDFDLERFMGEWYQQATVKSVLKDEAICTQYSYKANTQGAFDVESKMIDPVTGVKTTARGQAQPKQHLHKAEPAHFQLIIDGDNGNSEDYAVLATDYLSYALVYGCWELRSILIYKSQRLQILSRERMLNTSVIVSAFQEVRKQGLEDVYGLIHTVDQVDCTVTTQDTQH